MYLTVSRTISFGASTGAFTSFSLVYSVSSCQSNVNSLFSGGIGVLWTGVELIYISPIPFNNQSQLIFGKRWCIFLIISKLALLRPFRM